MYKVYTHTAPNGDVYVGVTSMEVKLRWLPSGYKGTTLEPYINEYGWKAIKHEVIYTTPDREEAYQVEDEMYWYYKEKGVLINKQRSGLVEAKDKVAYGRQWQKDHKEERAAYQRQYHQEHKKERNERSRQWQKEHKEDCNERSRQYYQDNKKECNERSRQWKKDHKDEHNAYMRQWRAKKKAEKLLQDGQIEMPIAV